MIYPKFTKLSNYRGDYSSHHYWMTYIEVNKNHDFPDLWYLKNKNKFDADVAWEHMPISAACNSGTQMVLLKQTCGRCFPKKSTCMYGQIKKKWYAISTLKP